VVPSHRSTTARSRADADRRRPVTAPRGGRGAAAPARRRYRSWCRPATRWSAVTTPTAEIAEALRGMALDHCPDRRQYWARVLEVIHPARTASRGAGLDRQHFVGHRRSNRSTGSAPRRFLRHYDGARCRSKRGNGKIIRVGRREHGRDGQRRGRGGRARAADERKLSAAALLRTTRRLQQGHLDVAEALTVGWRGGRSHSPRSEVRPIGVSAPLWRCGNPERLRSSHQPRRIPAVLARMAGIYDGTTPTRDDRLAYKRRAVR